MDTSRLAVHVPLQVMGLSVGYAAALGVLERKFPLIKPDHIWAEVAGGVLITLLPVSLAARQLWPEEAVVDPQGWRIYESTIWRAFVASGTPIILWQLGEAVVRRRELLSYRTRRRNPAAAVIHGLCAAYQSIAGGQADVQPTGETAASAIQRDLGNLLREAYAQAAQAQDQLHRNPGLAMLLVSEAQDAAEHALARLMDMAQRDDADSAPEAHT
jgi:hypothetical protein